MNATTVEFNLSDSAPMNDKAMKFVDSLCYVCGRALGKNPMHFEVNTSWELIIPGSDEANSQGCFPIGQSCANKFAPKLLVRLGA
jgi:hypothetical protein